MDLQPGEALLGPQESATFGVAVSGSAYGHGAAQNVAKPGATIITTYPISAADPARR